MGRWKLIEHLVPDGIEPIDVYMNIMCFVFKYDIGRCSAAPTETPRHNITHGIDIVSRILTMNVGGEQSHSFSRRNVFLRRINAVYAVAFAMQSYRRTADNLLEEAPVSFHCTEEGMSGYRRKMK